MLANSLVASILSILHAYQLYARDAAYLNADGPRPTGTTCFSWGGDVLVVGIIANYAAVAADTFSSELGILSKSQPRLITSLTLRKVPPGTNGGVTLMGLAAGLFGSLVIVTAATVFLPFCSDATAELLGSGAPWTMTQRRELMGALIVWGALGSVLDSFLGAIFQRSVKDIRSGKIVEGEGGQRVLVSSPLEESLKATETTATATGSDQASGRYNPKNKHRRPSYGDELPSRIIENGLDWLDNNDVNFLMAVIMSVGAMAGASWYWEIPIQNVLSI